MKTNGEMLTGMLAKTVKDGEIPYQSNRRAVTDFDIFGDDEEGSQELMVMLEGLDIFIADLEAFQNAAERVSKQALNAVR